MFLMLRLMMLSDHSGTGAASVSRTISTTQTVSKMTTTATALEQSSKYDHDHVSSLLIYNISFSYDFTVLMSVGCTVGVLVAAYIMFRAYKLLFLTYCVSISRNSDQERSVEDSVCRIPRVRGCARSGSKGSTPPPPYDSPPPYHVAIVMYNNPDTPSNPVEISDPVYI